MKVNNDFKKTAIRAAREAGSVLMKNLGNMNSFSLKRDKSIVSKIDYSTEKRIIDLLKSKFPSHDIFSEESGGDMGKGYAWIVDALDGTTNYIARVPVFAVSVALFYNKEPVLGVIYNSVLKELYLSEKGGGFWVNGKKPKKRLFSSDSVLVLGKGKGKKNIEKMAKILKNSIYDFRAFRIFACSALDLCKVADSKIKGFVLPGANFWDVAAGVLMVREAGGCVIDFQGKDWNIESKDLIAFRSSRESKSFLKNV